ncbi:MAG: OsmC family protein [Actinobacteria bacterium]|nr:OsmC family protein [Actinomycetota bacterium]
MTTTARVLEFDVTVDRDRTARSARGGSAISVDEAWAAEHLVLAGLVRCTLSSLDYSAERAGLEVAASGRAHGAVTKRDDDGRYAFVRIDVHFEVELDQAIGRDAVNELVSRAEKGCFVGNSLIARPGYHWTVNGEQLA